MVSGTVRAAAIRAEPIFRVFFSTLNSLALDEEICRDRRVSQVDPKYGFRVGPEIGLVFLRVFYRLVFKMV